MNTRLLLTIPTVEPLVLWERCVSSFCSSLIETSSLALVVYNGPDTTVSSDLSHSNVIKLGYDDCARVAQKLAESADCPEELLFGRQEYGRSYGGASNLLLAIAYGLGSSVVRKADDDCLQLQPSDASSLDTPSELASANKIYYGPYIGSPSGFLHELPRKTSIEWAKYIYSIKKTPRINELGTGTGCTFIENGNLILPLSALPIASYPVLFDPSTRTHARGEVYYWMSELRQHGFTFTYKQSLQMGHHHSTRTNLISWLRSLVLAFDLSKVYQTYLRTGKRPPILTRRKAISEFKSWILRADWPQDDIADTLCTILNEATLEFTEKFLTELPKRKRAWSRLMSNNLSANVQSVLPATVDKASKVWSR